jgi:hypothetical protein
MSKVNVGVEPGVEEDSRHSLHRRSDERNEDDRRELAERSVCVD